ncbi:MAG TPA: thioesterase family protein [Bacteroidales bacterium]|nr:thioesterase family protein [Bacteroidales bacterium]
MTNNFQFFHQIPVQIRFNDFDILKHITNSVYQNYFDLARTAYFEKVFNQKMQWQAKGLVLVKISIDFIRPILLNEEIDVFTKIYQLGNRSLRMTQKIVQTTTSELKATCDSVMVAYNNSADKPCPIPNRWRQKIIQFEKDIDFKQ